MQRFPTPEALAQAGKRQWQKFLQSRRLWGSDQVPRRMEIFAQASEFAGSQPTIQAKSENTGTFVSAGACDKHLRHAIYLFAEQSLSRALWADIYYQHHRQKNQSHANAIRRLGHRWLKIIHKMWIDRTPYDPELHHRNQLQHGSWIFQLKEC